MLSKYELLIFDWDGTVMDSVPRIVSCLSEAAKATGGLPDLDGHELKQVIGLSLERCYEVLYPEAPKSMYETWKGHYRDQFVDLNPVPHYLFDGVADTLTALKERGLKLAVATGKSRVGLDRAFGEAGIEALFDASRTADETASKPDPLMIVELLEELGVKPESALMIGDTSHDMKLAINAGVDAIAVSWGVHTKEELSSYSPVKVIEDIRELLA